MLQYCNFIALSNTAKVTSSISKMSSGIEGIVPKLQFNSNRYITGPPKQHAAATRNSTSVQLPIDTGPPKQRGGQSVKPVPVRGLLNTQDKNANDHI